MNPSQYVGMPFLEKGRDANGCDCWGLVRLVYKQELGLDLPSYDADYQTTLHKQEIGAKIDHEKMRDWITVKADEAQPYDVILLKMLGFPMHVGVVTQKGKMLHIMQGINATLEPYTNLRWKSKIIGFYRYAGSK